MGLALGCFGLNKWTEVAVDRFSQQNIQNQKFYFFQISSIKIQYIFTILKAIRPIEISEEWYEGTTPQLTKPEFDRVQFVLGQFPNLYPGIVQEATVPPKWHQFLIMPE